MTDIKCPHCNQKIRLHIESDPQWQIIRVDVVKGEEEKKNET
jgi:glutaredoxin